MRGKAIKKLLVVTLAVLACGDDSNPESGPSPTSIEDESPLVGAWRYASSSLDDENIDLSTFPDAFNFYQDGRYTATGGTSGMWSVRGDELTLDDGEMAATCISGVGGKSLSILLEVGEQAVVFHFDRVE